MMILDANQVADLFRETISQNGCDLIEIKIKGSRSKPILQVFIDRDGGVTVDDCAKITRQITEILDLNFPDIPQYRIEVSSPGTDRPLTIEPDFKRNQGRSVKINYYESGSEKTIEGKIEKTDPVSVFIRSGNDLVEISYQSIQTARVQLRW